MFNFFPDTLGLQKIEHVAYLGQKRAAAPSQRFCGVAADAVCAFTSDRTGGQ
jgi:hypothetical protein